MNRDRNTRSAIVTCLILGAATIFVFWPVARCEFINFDDPGYVTENDWVKGGLTWPGFLWAFSTAYAANWHPLTWLSHMLDVQWFGMNPAGHHLMNLFFHTANTVLLFLVLRRMTGALWRSALVAALFAVHPLHVESVAWISERKDVLSSFFFLLTLWAYARYVQRSEAGGRRPEAGPLASDFRPLTSGCYWLALFFFTLGLLSKPMLVTLPFVLLLLDYWPLGRMSDPARPGLPDSIVGLLKGRVIWKLVREKTPFFILTAASSTVTFLVQRQGGAVESLDRLPFDARVENALVAYARYLGKCLWPDGLAVTYPHPFYWSPWAVGITAILLATLTFAGLHFRRARPYFIVGWLWYLGMLVPVIGLVQVGGQSMADRYTYLPLIGLFIAMSWGLVEITRKYDRYQYALPPVAILLILGLSFETRVQLTYWANTRLLFEHALNQNADDFLAHYSLGNVLASANRHPEAIQQYQESVRLNPRYAEAYNNWGVSLAFQGRFEEAIPKYESALTNNARFALAHSNLGLAYGALGDYKQAAAHLSAAIALRPEDEGIRICLAYALLSQGQLERATEQFQNVLRNRPNNKQVRLLLAETLSKLGKIREAAGILSGGLADKPDAQSYRKLALALLMDRQFEAGARCLREAMALNPDWPEALNEMAWLLATSPEPKLLDGVEAVRLAEKACALTDHKQARFLGTLDAAYAESGRFDDAERTAQKARELALAAGQQDIAQAAEQRLSLYRLKRPYHQNLPKDGPQLNWPRAKAESKNL